MNKTYCPHDLTTQKNIVKNGVPYKDNVNTLEYKPFSHDIISRLHSKTYQNSSTDQNYMNKLKL